MTSGGCEHFFLTNAWNMTGVQILDELGQQPQPGDVNAVIPRPDLQGCSMASARDPERSGAGPQRLPVMHGQANRHV